MMKQSIAHPRPVFSGDRMVKQYAERFYLPAADRYRRLAADGFRRAKEIAQWKKRVADSWQGVAVTAVTQEGPGELVVGDPLALEARVRLGALTPDDVRVEIYHGPLLPDGTISQGAAEPMQWTAAEGEEQVYRGAIPSEVSGTHAYAVRVLPAHEDVLVPNEMTQVAWE